MHAILDAPAPPRATECRGASVTIHGEPTEQNVEQALWTTEFTGFKMAEVSLRIGIPLHRVEDYLDWLDMR